MLVQQKLPVVAEKEGKGINVQHGFRGPIDGGDGAVAIHGDNSGGYIAQDGSDIFLSLLQRNIGLNQPRLAFLQVVRHGIERLD